MQINRLCILLHKNELSEKDRLGSITIDEEHMDDIHMDWMPKFYCDETKEEQLVHAVQWFGDQGEVELVTGGSNIPLTELGIFEEAVGLFEKRKVEMAKLKVENELESFDAESYSMLELYGDDNPQDI